MIGILHVTDLLKAIADNGEVNAAALAREALTVPETLGADDLLAEMRRRGVRKRSSSTSTAAPPGSSPSNC